MDMEDLFENKVHLELWVKVKAGWADDERALRTWLCGRFKIVGY